jgi:hypothetical protein
MKSKDREGSFGEVIRHAMRLSARDDTSVMRYLLAVCLLGEAIEAKVCMTNHAKSYLRF